MTLPVDPPRYLAFLGAMAILAATPGPSNLFAIANGMSRGRKAVLLGVAGMNTATLIWYLAAALGLGTLALAFPQAVKLLIVIGALYLVWLAVKSIRSGFAAEGGLGHATVQPGRSAYWDSFLVQIANPKILLFFGAVLPPFLDFRKPLAAQFVLFAAATVILDVTATTAYGFGGAALSRKMTEPRFRRGFSLATAAVLLAAAGLIISRLA
ncbi:MAG: LysE family translocator [Ancalomicrobiaceae bacterium]|nr:LysE family translocator [Ancalomicrobiaceae bacterium]